MGFGSPWHWMIVLLVVVLLFGTKKIRSLGGDLGAAVRGFKKGMREDADPESAEKRALEDSPEDDSAASSAEHSVESREKN